MKNSLKPVSALQFGKIMYSAVRHRHSAFRRPSFMKKISPLAVIFSAFTSSTFLFVLTISSIAFAQDTSQTPATPPAQAPAYTPKFHGDPARSDSEAAALAYMRVVMRAEVGFNKQYHHYATTLRELVHSGTFTQRMVNPDRGDYTVGYRAKKDNFVLAMTPKQLDAQHRSFYAEDDGKIHADETKAADGDSQVVETHHW
jgi:hypothetical protein